MKGILKGKQVDIKLDDKILLNNGEMAVVVGDFEKHVVVRTDAGEVKPITMDDIAKIIEQVVQTVSFLVKIFRWFFPKK